MSEPAVHVFLATSLDGFIAGPHDELAWLDDTPAEPPPVDPDGLTWERFISGIGALLMGRRTYDVVRGFDVPWPYGDRPVLVATSRPLDTDPPATVRAVEGTIESLVREARAAAAPGDVYIDGGLLIRQALAADLIDTFTITLAPTALGSGIPLFAGLERAYPVEFVSHHWTHGGMVQLRMRPRRG